MVISRPLFRFQSVTPTSARPYPVPTQIDFVVTNPTSLTSATPCTSSPQPGGGANMATLARHHLFGHRGNDRVRRSGPAYANSTCKVRRNFHDPEFPLHSDDHE